MAKGYFFAKVVSRHEDEKMSNDFENSQEYRKALEIAKIGRASCRERVSS